MFNGKGPKYYQNKKPHHEYETYSESATSLEWPLWKHADELKRKRHVKFDKEYDYSSRDNLYDGRNINEHSYPYTYSSNNIYQTGNDIYDYHTEGSRYTLYDQSPHRIMYTETDSAYTTVDSDPNLTQRTPARDLGYKPKYRHNHSHRYKNKDTIPSEVTDIESSSFGGNLNVYFARQPTSHYAFMHKKPRGHDVTRQTESEVQGGTVTETDEESDYPTNDKGRQSNLQVYTTTVAENETNGVFNKGLQKNSQERLIAVTNYDNIPLLAFKSTNTSVSPQISMSGMVYLPVIVMQSEKKLSNPKNINTHIIPYKNCEVEEKSLESLKPLHYTALNTGQKNIFEKTQEENYESPQHHSKTNSNRQQISTALKIENTETSPTRESDLKSVTNKPKTSYNHLPSILRKLDRVENSKSSINSSSPKTEQTQLNQSQINSNRSNTSVSIRKSIPKAKNNKREENTSKKTANDTEVLKSNMSNSLHEYGDKKGILRTKSNTSNISQKSTKSISSVLPKKRPLNTTSSINKSETQSFQHLIGKSLSGSEKGSSFYHKAHQRELQARKEKLLNSNMSNSLHEYGDKKGILRTKSNTSNISQKSTRSISSVLPKKRPLNTTSSINKSETQSFQHLIGKSLSGSEKGSSFYHKTHQRELQARKEKLSNSNMSNSLHEYGDKKGILRTKSNTSNISQKSTKSISSVLTKKSAARRSRSSTNKSQTQSVQHLIGKSPSGSERGSSFYNKAHQKELQARRKKHIRKSKITKGEQEMRVTKQNPSEAFKSPGESDLSTYEKNNVNSKNSKSTSTITSQILPESKLAPNNEFRKSLSDIKADGSESTPLSKQKQSQVGNNTNNNLSETRRTNGANKSIVQQEEISDTVLEISTNNKKSALGKYPSGKNKKETNIRKKSFTEKNEPAETNSAIEIIKGKQRKPSTQQIILQNNDSNKKIKYEKIEGSKLKSQPSDPNQGRRKSSQDRSTVGETKKLSKTSTVQNQGTNIKLEQDNTEERTFKTQHTDLNQTVQQSKKSLVKQSSKAEETKPSQKSLLQNQNTEIQDNHSRSEGINRNKTQTAEEEKSVLNKKSQIQEYQSKDKINEGASKSVVRETIGVNKSGTSVAQHPRPTREESISKVSGSPGSNVQENQRIITKEEKIEEIISLKPLNEDDKNQKSATKVSNYSQNGPGLAGGKSITYEKSKAKSPLAEENSIINDQRKTIQEKHRSIVNRKSNTKDSMYIPVDEQKHGISYGKKQTSNGQKDMDQRTSKTNKKSLQKKSLISSNQNQSELISPKKKASKVSKQSSRREMQHCYKLWGYDCSTLISFCFQIAQFILGVSTHDKFIEIMGNFD